MKKIIFSICFFVLSFWLMLFIYKHNRDLKILSSPVIRSNKSVVLVIHLDRALNRKNNVEKIYSDINKIPALHQFSKITIHAIDGKQLTHEKINKHYKSKLIKPYTPNSIKMSNNVIACFLSHRKAWQFIVDNNFDSALIFEDDASIDPIFFKQALQIGLNNLRQNFIIRFKLNQPKKIESFFGLYNSDIYIPLIPPPVTASYLISKESAQKLLDSSKKFDRPVDDFLKLAKYTNIYSGEIYPSGIKEISHDLGGSTINYKSEADSLLQKIKREIERLYYRLKLI